MSRNTVYATRLYLLGSLLALSVLFSVDGGIESRDMQTRVMNAVVQYDTASTVK